MGIKELKTKLSISSVPKKQPTDFERLLLKNDLRFVIWDPYINYYLL